MWLQASNHTLSCMHVSNTPPPLPHPHAHSLNHTHRHPPAHSHTHSRFHELMPAYMHQYTCARMRTRAEVPPALYASA
jgi:hypothetical protein